MSNPFDQFAVDVSAALPSGASDPNNPFGNGYGPAPTPAPSDKPSMNGYGQPPMGMGQPQMGMGQPQMYGGMMGQPPAQQGYGAPMMGAPPTPQRNAPMMGAPPTPGGAAPAANDPFASYGAPVPQPGAFDAPPTPRGAPPPFMAPPGAPPTPGGAPPPFMAPPGAPPTPGGAPPHYMAPPGAPPTPGRSVDPFSGYGAPAPQPAADPFSGYGAPAPQPSADPFSGYGAPAPQPAADPFSGYGAPAPGYGAPPPTDPSAGALVVSQTQSNPYAQALPPQQQQYGQASDPFGGGGYGAPPPQQYSDPFGGGGPPPGQPQYGMPPASDPYGGGAYGAQPPAPAPVDPFSVFNSAPAPPPQPAGPPQNQMVPAQPPQQQDGDDMWGELGFGAPPNGQTPAPAPRASQDVDRSSSGDLPPGGEFYDARIFTPTLGVMFFKPQELTDSLFLNTDRSVIDGLADRPVVAFIVEGSSARSAGVELGHVLLKVNGVDVKNPKDASRLIKEGPRPLPLLFYVPSTDVVVAEGEHMVKYDTRDTNAPNSAKDWKPKYVVIGGIIAQPWMMNMYRSKSEYDIAVIETQARRPVSVKVKQFSLQGARIQNDWQGPQMVKYKNKLHPWKYIVVLPVARNPIKISSPNLASLKPVHEGIRRVLLAQQRSRGGSSRNAAPRPDSEAHQEAYSSQAYGQQQQQQQQQQYRY